MHENIDEFYDFSVLNDSISSSRVSVRPVKKRRIRLVESEIVKLITYSKWIFHFFLQLYNIHIKKYHQPVRNGLRSFIHTTSLCSSMGILISGWMKLIIILTYVEIYIYSIRFNLNYTHFYFYFSSHLSNKVIEWNGIFFSMNLSIHKKKYNNGFF